MANHEKQYTYTFLNMKRCVGKNDKHYIGVTMEALVTRPDQDIRLTQNGNGVISFNAPVCNRAKYIETMCGMAPEVSNDGTCWVRISLWDTDREHTGLATRFKSLMDKNNGKSVVLLVTGSIKVEQKQGNDNKIYTNVNIMADDFTVLRVFVPKERDERANGQAYPDRGSNGNHNAPAHDDRKSQYAASQDEIPDGINGFVYMEDLDEELPF